MKKDMIFLFLVSTLYLLLSAGFMPDTAEAQVGSKKAIVTKDPSNKREISGYIHIAFVWGQQLSPPRNLIRGFINLKEAMHRWTNFEVKIDKHLYLSSPKLLKMPFIYVTTDKAFELSESEKKNVRKYFDSGGFMVLENATPYIENGQAEASLRKLLWDTLGSSVRLEPIPVSHPLYHCFFNFDDGPPLGAEIPEKLELFDQMPRQVHYLEGVFYKGRLIVVFSNKGYIVKWNKMTNNEPQLKMGVNMVVFSLIQKGGIAED